MSQPPVKVIFGAATFATYSQDDRHDIVRILKHHGVTELDTARSYPDSEATIGKTSSLDSFIVHTKVQLGQHPRAGVLASAQKSLKALGVPSVDVYFFHAPDPTNPLDESLSAINELYKQGKFKRFGLSNFSAAEVEEVHQLASSRGWVLPTVYEGKYNPVARHMEKDLLPVLRKLEIAFFAYSPVAGGFFAKDPDALLKKTETGRFDSESVGGQFYNSLYSRPSIIAALREWKNIARAAETTDTELAIRWMTYHSALQYSKGDAIITGASRPSQLEDTLTYMEKGPLPKDIAASVDRLWLAVADEAPVNALPP
ncbi:hypothetical protein BBP40_005385 [Aspergillus hancockii]|nr:hypothetical protein BBP40_005385 [Aspergillus hancockii]